MKRRTLITQNGLSVDREGQGDPLLVIPGGPGASSKLYRRYLAPLADVRTLIFWDYRGTGQSADPGRYGFHKNHQDLYEVIRE